MGLCSLSPSVASGSTSCSCASLPFPSCRTRLSHAGWAPFLPPGVSVGEVIKSDGGQGTSSSALALPSLATQVLFTPATGSSPFCLFPFEPEIPALSAGASVKNHSRGATAPALGQHTVCLPASCFPFCYHHIMFAGQFGL